ncbi:hypothetical protein BST61_g8439 [Cercospora zeina]
MVVIIQLRARGNTGKNHRWTSTNLPDTRGVERHPKNTTNFISSLPLYNTWTSSPSGTGYQSLLPRSPNAGVVNLH